MLGNFSSKYCDLFCYHFLIFEPHYLYCVLWGHCFLQQISNHRKAPKSCKQWLLNLLRNKFKPLIHKNACQANFTILLILKDVASAAESGWDFSSRWFHDKWHISTIETTDIAPVDLNAFICYNLGILSYFYRLLGENIMQKDQCLRSASKQSVCNSLLKRTDFNVKVLLNIWWRNADFTVALSRWEDTDFI